MSRRYFGTDGIRGRVGEAPISADFMLRLGRAAGVVLAGTGSRQVLIGKDTRLSGYMFESALEAGLAAAGVNVGMLGPMPTPAVAYLTRSFKASAGVVISASHNPHEDNGIKFFDDHGGKLDDALEAAIEAELEQPFTTVAPDRVGRAFRVADASGRYIQFCKSTVPETLDLQGLKLVIDCAHGACYDLGPRVFKELGAEVFAIGNQPDGLNINLGCGATDLALLSRTVVERGADLGIAFDGDGDRVQFVDPNGQVADGDDLLYLLANDWHLSGRLRGPVIGTLMSNYGLERALADAGIDFERAAVGDRYVLQRLQQKGGVLGGETSGHMLCLDRTTTGDGIVSALQVLELIQRRGQSLATLRAGLVKVPQITRNVRAPRAAASHPSVKTLLDSLSASLEGRGRVFLRPSGTEPVIRVTVEVGEPGLAEQLAARLAEAVASAA